EGILRGMHRLPEGAGPTPQVQLLGSGTILNEVRAAAEVLRDEFDVQASVWSVTSFTELRRDGLEAERWNLLHPAEPARNAYVSQQLAPVPTVAATDYIRTLPDLIRQWVPGPYRTLGTDGFGRSDRRAALRDFFEVDRRWIAVAALRELAAAGEIGADVVSAALRRFEIDSETPPPVSR
ncbi:MAG TPA: pyruvate dehydrogenase (acetyl-transferring), homodimeric type, partial [Solirubrobacteraceae bacterium]|nr:pyruvate dehydrogenase (acetyl-transferring), homodimeric type [Solirubrobacteraceae bacterium]